MSPSGTEETNSTTGAVSGSTRINCDSVASFPELSNAFTTIVNSAPSAGSGIYRERSMISLSEIET